MESRIERRLGGVGRPRETERSKRSEIKLTPRRGVDRSPTQRERDYREKITVRRGGTVPSEQELGKKKGSNPDVAQGGEGGSRLRSQGIGSERELVENELERPS